MNRIDKFIADLPLLTGLAVGSLFVIDLIQLPSLYITAALFPFAFFLSVVGIALFGSFIGAITGMALNVIMDPYFLDKYLNGE
jgi:hypothetical protein